MPPLPAKNAKPKANQTARFITGGFLSAFTSLRPLQNPHPKDR
ncbi:hypothetical protein HMPREF9371_1994 [Neisseria shayeganii 871]|uniref:Uncharacterized protein n=1 Tax=Neisseria shayeganii 871 TaxID=1032488 RepID=G4CK54_9NEIS|nr:hypothetical protein HMPREF9371_1994 [Neisseria shayeganii 871]